MGKNLKTLYKTPKMIFIIICKDAQRKLNNFFLVEDLELLVSIFGKIYVINNYNTFHLHNGFLSGDN
jgi:hypothetical protein